MRRILITTVFLVLAAKGSPSQTPLAPLPGGGATALAGGAGPQPLVPYGSVKITYDDFGFPHIEAVNGGTGGSFFFSKTDSKCLAISD
jgi:hypothetical protein